MICFHWAESCCANSKHGVCAVCVCAIPYTPCHPIPVPVIAFHIAHEHIVIVLLLFSKITTDTPIYFLFCSFTFVHHHTWVFHSSTIHHYNYRTLTIKLPLPVWTVLKWSFMGTSSIYTITSTHNRQKCSSYIIYSKSCLLSCSLFRWLYRLWYLVQYLWHTCVLIQVINARPHMSFSIISPVVIMMKENSSARWHSHGAWCCRRIMMALHLSSVATAARKHKCVIWMLLSTVHLRRKYFLSHMWFLIHSAYMPIL